MDRAASGWPVRPPAAAAPTPKPKPKPTPTPGRAPVLSALSPAVCVFPRWAMWLMLPLLRM